LTEWRIEWPCRCQQDVTAADVEAFCRTAKEATRGRVICGAFYALWWCDFGADGSAGWYD
jgi:hypothetical protein